MTTYLKTSSELRFSEMDDVLEAIIYLIRDMLTSENADNDAISEIRELLELFLHYIFNVNFLRKKRLELLTKLLTELLEIPIQNRIDISFTLLLYEKLNIINMLTFLIFQTRHISFQVNTIATFLDYMMGNENYNYYALLFYRINPRCIKENICIELESTTPKELYYGIEYGYFPYWEGESESYVRLEEMVKKYRLENRESFEAFINQEDASQDNAFPVIELSGLESEPFNDFTPVSVLKLLRQDGYVSKYAYDKLLGIL